MKQNNKKASSCVPRFRVDIGSGFILLFAVIYFFDSNGLIVSLIPCLIVHELGHVLAMLLFDARPTRLNCTLAGFSMDYTGDMNELHEMLTALAGPAAGFAFSLLCAKLGRLWGSDYLLMCAGLGFILNTFNLLPTMSLDGGRILSFLLNAVFNTQKARRIFKAVGITTVFLLLAFGLYFIVKGQGIALFISGILLFVLQFQD